MKRILDTSQVLGTLPLPEGEREVCAEAVATYDEPAGRLVVNLEAFLRPTGITERETHTRTTWLPETESVTEHAEPDEAIDLARDIFHGWVRKVRQAAPPLHAPAL